MTHSLFVIHPELMLMSKNGRTFGSCLSPDVPPLPLNSLDVYLIALLSKPASIEQLINHVLNLPFAAQINSIDQVVSERINIFLNAGILLSGNSSNIKSRNRSLPCLRMDKESKDDFKSEPEHLSPNKKFKIDRNFALFPYENGYIIWSAKIAKYCRVSIKQALILLCYSSGLEMIRVCEILSGVCSELEVKISTKTFLEFGLLIEHNEEKKSEATESEKTGKNTTSSIPNKEMDWQAISPDDRTPIYFVPHMENHYPLALGMLFSSIKNYKEGKLLEKFQLIPITYLPPEEFLKGPYTKFGKGIWLFSNYMWSLEINLKVSEVVKQHNPENLTIHGGPSTPNYQAKTIEFFERNSSVDIAVHNEGEVAICEILDNLESLQLTNYNNNNLAKVSGITFKDSTTSKLIRNDERVRVKEPDLIPSPYTGGVFDNYHGEVEAAIIESNRGCPFGCTFCDWGSATNQKVRKFELERVKDEIDWIANRRVRVLWIADANFGMYDRDIELAEHIVKTKKETGFPVEVVVNYTKNSTWRLAKIIQVFNEGGIISQGVISIQTADTQTLEVINRKNIKTSKYDELSEVFDKQNLPLSTDLMIGLPGATVDSFKGDLQRYFDKDVSVKAYPTQLLPNSPMADPDYIKKYEIKYDEQGYLISTFSYTQQQLESMKELYKFFTIADGYSVLRYLLRFLQWDYGIQALDFLSQLQEFLKKNPAKYPLLNFCFRFFDVDKSIPGGWKNLFEEVKAYVKEQYNFVDSNALKCVLSVSELQMPEESRDYPISAPIRFDFASYFTDKKKGDETKKLIDYSPAQFSVEDPDGTSKADFDSIQYDSHQFFWELRSPVSRAKSMIS